MNYEIGTFLVQKIAILEEETDKIITSRGIEANEQSKHQPRR